MKKNTLEKNYPDSCYGDKPLSPHWDYFQDGVEFGERESEKKIEDLEHKLEQTEKDLADYQFNYPTIKELQKENAELKAQYAKECEDVCYIVTNYGKQLTKAKEIIKMLVHDCYSIAECEDTNLGLWEDDLAKAEAFLNSKVEE